MFHLIMVPLILLLGAVIFTVSVTVFGWLWVWIAVGVFSLPSLSFWQLAGVMCICQILFGGSVYQYKK